MQNAYSVYINNEEQAIATRFTWVILTNITLSKKEVTKEYTQYDFLRTKIPNWQN